MEQAKVVAPTTKPLARGLAPTDSKSILKNVIDQLAQCHRSSWQRMLGRFGDRSGAFEGVGPWCTKRHWTQLPTWKHEKGDQYSVSNPVRRSFINGKLLDWPSGRGDLHGGLDVDSLMDGLVKGPIEIRQAGT